jgi:outer membrane protein
MKISKYNVLIVLIIALQIYMPAQKKLSLHEAVVIALHQSSTLVKSINTLDVSSEAVKLAYGNLLPTLGINGGFSWKRVTDSGGNSQLDYFGNEQVLGSSKVDSRSWSASIGGTVILFDGLANLATIDQSKSSLHAARLDLEKAKQDITLQTVNYFIAIISYKKLLDFQKEDLNYNQALSEKIKKMYEIKTIAITDVFSQDAQTANSELVYLQTENNYQKSKIALLNYLALDVTSDYTFSCDPGDMPDTSMMYHTSADLLQAALGNRKDFQSSAYKIKMSESQLAISNADWYPTLTGDYGFSTNATSPGELFSRRTYSAGVSLSLPIFSQFTTEYAIEYADVQLKNANEDSRALERQIKTDVECAFLDMQTAKKQSDVSQKALQYSEQSWKAKGAMYALGAAAYLDLQLSYNNYLQARYNVITNDYKYTYTQFVLMGALGSLNK